MGPHVVETFLRQGHEVRVIDRDAEGLQKLAGLGVDTVAGSIADKELVRQAVQGMDAVLHLAWSFAENFVELLDVDVKAYQYILDAAVEFGVKHIVNATTAVSYGKPTTSPVDETHPHLVAQSRNPTYALAKLITEEMGKICAEQHGLSVNNVMIWYAYGNVIGGRQIRGMIRDAIEKGTIEVPAGCGGSFLQLDDFAAGVLAIFNAASKGEMFNLGTVYLTWEELGEIIVAQANPAARVVGVPKTQWTGSAFLAEDWHFSTDKAESMLGYRSALTRDQALAHLSKSLQACIAEVKARG
jgi:UDP-glucose 4-epimerase